MEIQTAMTMESCPLDNKSASNASPPVTKTGFLGHCDTLGGVRLDLDALSPWHDGFAAWIDVDYPGTQQPGYSRNRHTSME